MRITVLDGYTLNPGDNPWTEIEKLGELTVYDRTPPELINERAQGSRIILTNKTPLSADTLRALPDLEFISVLATGYNIVDGAAAARQGIPVSNVPAYGTQSVAQHTIALLLELCNSVGLHDDSVRMGEWAASPDFCYWKSPIVELSGRILGIVGAGRIGRAVAAIGQALGMDIRITPSRQPAPWKQASVEEIFRLSDVVSLHCPQSSANAGFVNRTLLRTMKPDAFLINTSRGGLIVEADLAEALKAGWIAGAAIDVVSTEPVSPENPLLTAPRCIITPHIAWSSLAARRRIMAATHANICGFLIGRAPNCVNGPV